jgi:hypothetical protein
MSTSPDPVVFDDKSEFLGQEAVRQLQNLVAIRYFNAAPRVNGWAGTLELAFAAHFAGDDDRLVDLPENATTPDGGTVDRASHILGAFNDWLGHDAIDNIIDFVLEEVAW